MRTLWIACLFCAVASAQDGYQAGLERARARDYEGAMAEWQKAAETGDARAMEKLIELARDQTIEDLALQVERGLATTEESILARYAEALLDSRGIGNTEDTVEDNIAGEVSDET